MPSRLSYALQHFHGPSTNCGNRCSVIMPASLWSGPCSADSFLLCFSVSFCFNHQYHFSYFIAILFIYFSSSNYELCNKKLTKSVLAMKINYLLLGSINARVSKLICFISQYCHLI